MNELYKINNRLPFTVRLSSDFLLNDMFVYFLLNQKCKKNLFIEFSINEEIVSKKFINNVKKIKGQGYSLSLFFSEKEKTKVNLMSTLPFEQITFSSDIVKNIEEGYQHYKHLKYLNDSAISLGIKRVIFDGVNSLNQLKLTNLINNKSSSQGLIYECHSEPSVLLKESNIIQSDNFNSPEVFLEWLTYNYITSKKNQDCFNKISICSPDCKNYSNQSEVFDKLVENHYKNQNETTSFIHNIIKNSDNMFVLRNSEGVVLFENKNHENFFGRSLNGLTVQDVVSIMPDYQLCIEDDKHLLDSNEMFSVKKKLLTVNYTLQSDKKSFLKKIRILLSPYMKKTKGYLFQKTPSPDA
ncbi:hypothetical protein [Vibrio fortis]|uniref:hypothetical protein n=1 Tax=Vibrio fortis TaxID=212667 RepID=UPI0039911A89